MPTSGDWAWKGLDVVVRLVTGNSRAKKIVDETSSRSGGWSRGARAGVEERGLDHVFCMVWEEPELHFRKAES